MQIETEIKKLRQEFSSVRSDLAELRKLICGKNLVGNWVKQELACVMLNVKPRRMRDIRKHIDKDGKTVGCIRWRKGSGKTVEYYKPDLEAYISKITVQ